MRKALVIVTCAFVLGFSGAISSTAEGLTDFNKFSGDIFKVPAPVNTESSNARAGGEDCASATVIGSLPYDDSGTTLGFVDDYDEVCPFTGSTSPDVVYTYTPAADETVLISLCNAGGDANYDTKLYVYEGSCTTPSLACNDDDCQAPSYAFGAYNSQLATVNLTGGTAYYIVVDGYGGDAGDYTLHVEAAQPPPPTPTCGAIGDPGFLIGQDVHGTDDSWSAAVSGQAAWQAAPYIVAESIDQAADPDWFDVSSFNVWGLSLENSAGWAACDPTGMTFDVIFYEDAAGVPGTEICNVQSAPAAATMTGLQYNGFELYQFDITAACDLGSVGRKWMSVQSEPMIGDCAFLWMSALSGDGYAPRDSDGDGVWETDYLFDNSMCINGATIPVGLLSFSIE